MTSDDVDIERAIKTPYALIVADVVGHPDGEPSIDDIDDLNPGYDEGFLRDLLDDLVRDGVVERDGDTVELTDAAREAFDERGVFPEGAWRRQYDRVERGEEKEEKEEACPGCGRPYADYIPPGEQWEGTSRGTLRMCVLVGGAFIHTHQQVMNDPGRESPLDE